MQTRQTAARQAAATIDEGLRGYMLQVYNTMATGVGVTALVAYIISSLAITADRQLTPFGEALFGGALFWVLVFSPLLLCLWLGFAARTMSTGTAAAIFYAISGLMGVSLSTILMAYTSASVTQVFAITAASFGALSLWGYTTRRDLSAMGSFLLMGLFGIILASLANIFFQSGTMSMAISVIAVFVYAGFTAYDTQKIKEIYDPTATPEMVRKLAILGALNLYLNAIGLFMHLVNLLGDQK
jgi:Integral membrane protein, interacts with FtsH